MRRPLRQITERLALWLLLFEVRPYALGFHTEGLEDERIEIRQLLDLLRHRLATTVTRARFDADQDRVVAAIVSLQRGRKLLGVRRRDTVVMIRRRDQHGRIFHARL